MKQGQRQIRRVMVANRGEIACRVIRSCHELGIEVVAVYSAADRDLPHVLQADQAVCIGPSAPERSYLNSEALLGVAARTRSDAVHPGYGFLSESATFAEAVQSAGLIWIGPPAAAMRAMGDKIAARRLAQQHGIPTILGYDGEEGEQDEALLGAAVRVGFPLLVKASAGGGGRGMRLVHSVDELPVALSSARRESQAAFGSDRLLLERYVSDARHIELQILADDYGRVIHLFERECSIQRRHQKMIEESPSPAVDEHLRARMGEAAVRIAQVVGYRSAGTVEFIVDGQGDFYFLEMNTRLQVEHPVTEMVTGLDLVAEQVRIAEGRPMRFEQHQVELSGHAIEARVYAEDPMRDYQPCSGRLVRFDLPVSTGVRVDAGYAQGDEVSVHYDALLAKVIAWGPDRADATRRLLRAVKQGWVPGVATNLPLLRQVFEHSLWQTGQLDTHFLQRSGLPRPPQLNLIDGALAATALSWWLRRRASPYPKELPLGWRVGSAAVETDRWRCLDHEVVVACHAVSRDVWEAVMTVPEQPPCTKRVVVVDREGDWLRFEVDGEQHRWRVARRERAGGCEDVPLEDGEVVYAHTGQGEAMVSLVPRLPVGRGLTDVVGGCLAPAPGTVVELCVQQGQRVVRGQRLAALESMKMEQPLLAPEDGVVTELCVAVGETVDEGTLLVRLEPSHKDES